MAICLTLKRVTSSAKPWKPNKMEFLYLFLIMLGLYYGNEFWKAHITNHPWENKKLNLMGGKLADRAETVPVGYEEDVYDEDDYEEEVSYPLSAREMKEQHNQRREAEAASKNQRNEEIFRAYGSILRESLAATHSLDFNTLYEYVPLPVYSVPPDLIQAAPRPKLETYRKSKVNESLSRFYPGHETRQIDADEEQSYLYNHALVSWEAAEQSRITSLQLYKAEFEKQLQVAVAHNDAVCQKRDRLSDNYMAGDEFVIAAYAKKILELSPYPEWLSRKIKTVYVSASKQLVVDFDLPKIAVVPHRGDFRFVKSTDKIASKNRKQKDIDDDYTRLISALALKALYEVFESDRGSLIDVCCFNGYLDTIDRSTGTKVRPCLISTRVTKEKFQQIDLAHVDARLCVRNLGSHVSGSASDLQAVKPIIEFNMKDRRFVEQGDLSFLTSAQNLMDLNPYEFEKLIVKLFQDMGLDAKLTQSSRDGGVDCVAYDLRPIIGGKVVIQAKRYRNTVGVSAVRDLYGTMRHEGANKGILVTTSGYGPDAFNFAKDKPIELIDGSGLLHYLQEVGVNARIVMPME